MYTYTCVYDHSCSASNFETNYVENKLINIGTRTENPCPLTPKFMYGISGDMISCLLHVQTFSSFSIFTGI